MATTAQETEQITHAVDLYVEGARDGDAAKLRDAFHPDARMWGSLAGRRFDIPIAEMIAMFDGKPADVDGSYSADVTAVEQSEDIASVTLVEEGFWGTVSQRRPGHDVQQGLRPRGGRAPRARVVGGRKWRRPALPRRPQSLSWCVNERSRRV